MGALSAEIIDYNSLIKHSTENQKLFAHDDKCDKYDYLIAAACGAVGGLMDIFLVGAPGDSVLGKWSDSQVDNAVKVIGDRNTNTNLRYKVSKNLSYNPKQVFEIKNPRKVGLPSPNVASTYIFAHNRDFFAYPNNYNYYVQYFRDTFQHGGISMEEMLIPIVTLSSK